MMQSNFQKPEVFIHQIATAVPEHSYSQAFALDFLLKLQGKTRKKREFLEKVYANTGIDKRHTVIGDYGQPPERYTFYPPNAKLQPEPETWYRNDVYIDASNKLALETATALFGALPGFDRQMSTPARSNQSRSGGSGASAAAVGRSAVESGNRNRPMPPRSRA